MVQFVKVIVKNIAANFSVEFIFWKFADDKVKSFKLKTMLHIVKYFD